MSVMQSGTQMVKLKAGSKALVRLFYLDEHRSCIRWKPSRKSEKAKSESGHATPADIPHTAPLAFKRQNKITYLECIRPLSAMNSYPFKFA